MHTLVTGGAGFIGSTLADRLLADGHTVDVVDDLSTGRLANLAGAIAAGARFEQIGICSDALTAFVAQRRPEVVFHLAAQASVAASIADPARDATVNVLGTVRVLDAARRAGVRKVVAAASGGTLYGDVDRACLPVAEDHPQRPTSFYGITKRALLDYLAAYRSLAGLRSAALALANVYGPRQDPSGEAGVVAIFAANLAAGRPSTIFGDGGQTRDFVYVDDVADAFVRAATSEAEGTFNIGTGRETSVNELYLAMARLARGAPPPLHGPARVGEVRASALDSSRAARLLGWRPATSLTAGLAAVLEHARASARTPARAS